MDETIVEISTDKVDAEVPAPAAGTMGEILAQPGDTVTVGQVIARMTSATAPPAPARPRRSRAEPAEPGEPKQVVASPTASAGLAGGPPRRRGPRHRPRGVKGTGPAGRIEKDDVLAAAPATAAAPRRAAGENATLHQGRAAMLARYMDESRSIPTATSFRTLTVTALDARRKELKAPATRSPSRT